MIGYSNCEKWILTKVCNLIFNYQILKDNYIDIILMVMKSAIFVWYLGQQLKLNTTCALELLPFGSGWGWGWGSVEMGRGNINRDNLCWHFLKRSQFFLFLVLFTWSDVLSIKFLESRTSGHLWPLRLFMRTDGGVDCKQVVLFSPKQFALKLSGSRIFMSVHVRFFLLPHYQALRYLKKPVLLILSSSLPQLFSVIFDVLLICYWCLDVMKCCW